MKFKLCLLRIFLPFVLFICFSSCSDDSTSPGSFTNFVNGYDNQESSECISLSAFAYVNENNPAYIKDSLIIQLANTKYATGGKWKLDWGPGLNSDNSNMMYVVKDTTTNPDRYAIAIRGTDWCYFYDWKEDLYSISMDRYPYGGSDDSVSHGAILGLNELLAMRDSSTNKTLVSYLNSISATNNKMYITGHSLGGQLATILSSWFLDNGYSSKFNLKTYTFAAPSTGNQSYVRHYADIFSATGSESYRVVNPLDLVPNFCATLDSVLVYNIPTTVPFEVRFVVQGLIDYLDSAHIYYMNVGQRHELGQLFSANCNYSPGTLEQYVCYVDFEHHPNTYLTLLNAPNIYFYTDDCDWGTRSGMK